MFAETEQMRLFAAVKLQASFIKKLCEELPNGATDLTPPGLAGRVSPHLSRPPIDESLYHALVNQATACYAQIDDVLGEFDRDGVTTSVHRNECDGEIQYFQHLNQFTEPYDYQHTHQTMWKLANLLHRHQDRRDLQGPGTPNDTVVIRFRLLRTLANGETISVLQRYVQEDKRTVFIWKTLSEGEDAFRGAHSEETGWVCLQPSTEEDSTLVKVCVRQVPLKVQVPYRCDALAEEFHQVLQNSVSEDMLETVLRK
ncbi:hypothetical protein ON010_g6701 [Phytophthora cinnamomi]|nr:hypothetical protein ON010_g6701 [Phytophthora cinnamomi]